MVWAFLRLFEAWAVVRLLQSQAFQKAVRRVHRTVHRLRHGEDLIHPDDIGGSGGTKLDHNEGSFMKHFTDELKSQAGWDKPKK